ncbi:hypothetical protein pb186bvf_000133 [Paramecium bursaria]
MMTYYNELKIYKLQLEKILILFFLFFYLFFQKHRHIWIYTNMIKNNRSGMMNLKITSIRVHQIWIVQILQLKDLAFQKQRIQERTFKSTRIEDLNF